MPTSAILEKIPEGYNFVRLFTHNRTGVYGIAEKYFKKYPEDVNRSLFVRARRRIDGKMQMFGETLEMDKPQ